MKTLRIISAALIAAATTISCNQKAQIPFDGSNGSVEVEQGICRLTVNLSSAAGTKTTTASAEKEDKVSNFQIFVFRETGQLDAYGKVVNAKTGTLECTQGQRKTYVVVNAPDLTDITNETALKSATSLLSHNNLSNFVMIGNTTAMNFGATVTVPVEVSHICAKIQILKIVKDFSSPALEAANFRVDDIFLTNVSGSIRYDLTELKTLWYNKMKDEGTVDNLELYHDHPAAVITDAYETAHTLYAYPNSSTEVTSGAPWSPRCTRIVLKAYIGDQMYYYPINLPALENNKNYQIKELRITRPGSTDPDTPVSYANCTFNITVLPFDPVIVSESMTI